MEIVIKYGGSIMEHAHLSQQFFYDVKSLIELGHRVTIVHGGGKDITSMLSQLNHQTSFIHGRRVTDKVTLDIAEMVLQSLSIHIANELNRIGLQAVTLSGRDAESVKAVKKQVIIDGDEIDLGYVGTVEAVDARYLKLLLNHDYIPVVAPIATNVDGSVWYNINADEMASVISGALHADLLIYLTDVDGVYKSYPDSLSLASTLSDIEAIEWIENGIVVGGMIPKVESCLSALESGTKRVAILNGSVKGIVLSYAAKCAEYGTTFYKEGE